MLLLSALTLGLVESTGQNVASGIGRENVLADSSGSSEENMNMENYTFRLDPSPVEWTIGMDFTTACPTLRTPHHLYYQLGNAIMAVAFLAPGNPYGQLWLRSVLVIGCVLMAMWGWLVECTVDAFVWAIVFLVINFIHVIVLLFRLRPVKFEKEIESVYAALFQPLRVSRHQFKKVLNCMKLVRSLKYQEVYAQEKVTKVDSLSLVLSGKLVVSQNQRALHIVFPHQFLDSPEWFGVSTDDFFQVSIMAMEESRVLIWHRDKLKLSIMAEPFLQAVFDHILGRDVVKKLMQVSETMAASNGFISSGYDDVEDKPMLLMKKTSDGHGITALINRQLQEEHVPLLGSSYRAFLPSMVASADLKTSTC
ncbi:blood vessel epicardial substance isoform X2 [Lutzomyia longipalpis]|uniref:blood vessel epicardial substance isoform X2 n=1 Tax=Lutzomyia longipalpis TaxID=7200 RepID=UPI0024841098|nr:blood vessel epicardial substance isoform X2 [Lutzomyia longipalpis]